MLQEASVPDHTDHDTVLHFAQFTHDSYFEPTDSKWIPIPGWNVVRSINVVESIWLGEYWNPRLSF